MCRPRTRPAPGMEVPVQSGLTSAAAPDWCFDPKAAMPKSPCVYGGGVVRQEGRIRPHLLRMRSLSESASHAMSSWEAPHLISIKGAGGMAGATCQLPNRWLTCVGGHVHVVGSALEVMGYRTSPNADKEE